MNSIDLCRARLQTVDVIRIANRKLNAAGYHAAAALLTDVAMDIAADLARERGLMQQTEERQS